MEKFNTRNRILIVSTLLTFFYIVFFEYSFDPVKPFLLAILTYLGVFWALAFKVKGERLITILLFPAIAVFSISLFAELIIITVFSQLGLISIILGSSIFFWVFTYITLLTVNIYKAAQAFDNLRDYFERAGAININYAQKSAAAVYGNIVNDIFGYFTKDIKLTKNASSATPPVKWNAVPFSFIKDAIEAIETHNAFKAKLDTIDTQLTKSANKKKVSTKDTIVGSIVDYLENKEAGLMSGVAGGAGLSITKNTLDSLTPKPEHDRVKDIVRELDSGGHAGNLQRIKMQSFLTELMLNDPVVSEYNPNDVYEAFNYLNEVAPRTVQHPVIAKSLIRRYLSQGNNIDAFEAAQLATIEKDLMRQTDSSIKDEMAFYGALEGSRHGSDDKN